MYQASEIVQLMLVVFLTPMIVNGIRSVTISGKRWFAASYLAMVCGYILTVVEGYVAADLMNIMEHVSYAAGGIFLALAMYCFSRDLPRRAEPL